MCQRAQVAPKVHHYYISTIIVIIHQPLKELLWERILSASSTFGAYYYYHYRCYHYHFYSSSARSTQEAPKAVDRLKNVLVQQQQVQAERLGVYHCGHILVRDKNDREHIVLLLNDREHIVLFLLSLLCYY